MKRSRLARYIWTATLAVIVAVAAALALAACGGSDTATTETAAPSQSVAAIISSTPTPTPTGTWTPGAKPIPAASIPAQKGSTEGFQSSTNGWEFKPTVDIQATHLGYFDDSGDGLRHPHPVGIFDVSTQKLLVKTTVEKKSPLDGAYRFAKIAARDPHGGRVLRGGHRLLPALRSRGQRPDGAGLRA